MKKSLLLSVAAIAAASLQGFAQYTCNPKIDVVLDQHPAYIDSWFISDAVKESLEANKSIKFQNIGENKENIFLDVWEATMVGGPAVAGVDSEGCLSFEVSNKNWSFCAMRTEAPGIDLSHITDDTHFHCAFNSTDRPTGIEVVLFDGGTAATPKPAKFALGGRMTDGGSLTAIAPWPSTVGTWQGVDITLGQLKKIYRSFTYEAINGWTGPSIKFSAGSTKGKNFQIDACYLWTPGEQGGVEGVIDDSAAPLVITANTINATAAEQIELYNVSGQLVRKVNGSVMGIADITPGIYVVKAGKKTAKVRI